MRRYFVGKTEKDVKDKIQSFLFAYNVELVNMRTKELSHSWEGCVDFNDPYGDYSR